MIRLSPVRLIDADGTQVGIVPIEHALELARQRGLDLVEVAPTARPIVCKIMDWGKYRYEQEKKAREARKKEHQIEVKEVKFRPGVADHDFQTKLNMVKRFLAEGKHVKVTICSGGGKCGAWRTATRCWNGCGKPWPTWPRWKRTPPWPTVGGISPWSSCRSAAARRK